MFLHLKGNEKKNTFPYSQITNSAQFSLTLANKDYMYLNYLLFCL